MLLRDLSIFQKSSVFWFWFFSDGGEEERPNARTSALLDSHTHFYFRERKANVIVSDTCTYRQTDD